MNFTVGRKQFHRRLCYAGTVRGIFSCNTTTGHWEKLEAELSTLAVPSYRRHGKSAAAANELLHTSPEVSLIAVVYVYIYSRTILLHRFYLTFDSQEMLLCWGGSGRGNPLRRSWSTVWRQRPQLAPRRRYSTDMCTFIHLWCMMRE